MRAPATRISRPPALQRATGTIPRAGVCCALQPRWASARYHGPPRDQLARTQTLAAACSAGAAISGGHPLSATSGALLRRRTPIARSIVPRPRISRSSRRRLACESRDTAANGAGPHALNRPPSRNRNRNRSRANLSARRRLHAPAMGEGTKRPSSGASAVPSANHE